jgi:hypothetical protein
MKATLEPGYTDGDRVNQLEREKLQGKAENMAGATSWKPGTIPSASNNAKSSRNQHDQLETFGRCSLEIIQR